jgi:hypothetical protein
MIDALSPRERAAAQRRVKGVIVCRPRLAVWKGLVLPRP